MRQRRGGISIAVQMPVTTRFAAILLGLSLELVGACHEGSSAASGRVTYTVVTPAAPCAGCTLAAPSERSGDLALLVTLHGDREHARSSPAANWRDAAVARGFVVLGLQCPVSLGCEDGRWYKANPSPSWVAEQIDAVARELPIDRSRVYLAGWSGGASYLGMNAPAWDDQAAAVVYHGGGQPPIAGDECPGGQVPAYFLVGDGNPAHGAAKRLRSYLDRCKQELTWDLLPGAGHHDEAVALDRAKADQIIDWLEDHARPADRPTTLIAGS